MKTKIPNNMNHSWRKCKNCGKLISYDNIQNQKNVKVVPVSNMEVYFIHLKCN